MIVSRVLIALGLTSMNVTVGGFMATMIYDFFVPPTDMHFAGVLTAAMIVYLLPFGLLSIILGTIVHVATSASQT